MNEENEMDDEIIHLASMRLAFQERRHLEKIESGKSVAPTWKTKDRMKTVSVALVMCLNVGVDPPDVVKTTPCARKECWIDPLTQSPQKALENIGNAVQKQYERWQPRARYRQSLDPTVDEIKRLCTSLRRNAKEERVLFHYNGHGVPRPTANGEIWVFNKSYTQYIPLSLYDLQSWMSSPSIFVYDCSSAGLIVNTFNSFALQREQESQMHSMGSNPTPLCDTRNCIQLAACSATQLLPMNPELPADLFTSCLTTPIKVALQWFCHQKQGSLSPDVTIDLIEKIPGRLNDRRTPLGELNWIFTAITDTIAWNTLPRDLFQKLFRQDLLVASLFRNFLLAERVMRSYKCTPVSSPELPTTFRHPMWASWDHTVDVCLSQLPQLLADESYEFRTSLFFEQHLTAFQVWLSYGVEHRNPPEQLPIVLQVLLSQVHRVRALDLLGRFLDLGPWAVGLALSVGIFPYVLKLLQSQAKELRPLLVFIWAKILAVDGTCQADLIKDGGHQYFLRALQDPQMSIKHRTMAAFVLAELVKGNLQGKEACLQRNIISICLDQLDNGAVLEHSQASQLKQWVAICLGRVWTNYDEARWRGVRDQAHERLYELLRDCHPEVRAAAVYALCTFVDNERDSGSDHAAHVNQAVGSTLALLHRREASVLVRCELTTALQRLVSCYDANFAAIAFRFAEEEKTFDIVSSPSKNVSRISNPHPTKVQKSTFDLPANYSAMIRQGGGDSSVFNQPVTELTNSTFEVDSQLTTKRLQRLRKISLTSLPSAIGSSYSSVNANIWKVLLSLASDPHPDVADLARTVVSGIMARVNMLAREQSLRFVGDTGSPRQRSRDSENDTPFSSSPGKNGSSIIPIQLPPYSRTRKAFWKGPDSSKEPFRASEVQSSVSSAPDQSQPISTHFCQWSASSFADPTSKKTPDEIADEKHTIYRQKLDRLLKMKKDADSARIKLDTSRLNDQQFFNKNPHQPVALTFNSLNNNLLVGDRSNVSVWECETGQRRYSFTNHNPHDSNICCMEFANLHSEPLLIVGSDDGCVRWWANTCREAEGGAHLVTAWQAVTDPIPSLRVSGIVTSWNQSTMKLYTGGDSRHIQVWDAISETKQQEFHTGADSCVTCLGLADDSLAAGCGDGTFRLFDTREHYSESSKRKPHQAHESWIVQCSFVKPHVLLSASEMGDIKLWDVRRISVEPVRTIKLQRSSGIRRLDVHPIFSIVACGLADPSVNFMDLDGNELCSVRYYEGFLGQRIGRISCMKFHPLRARLAVGTADGSLTVYSGEAKN